MTEYDPSELILIVAELTDMYTRGESTSVTYEAAQHLMEAVLYCIREAEQISGTQLKSAGSMDARSMYEAGFREVNAKVERTKEKYKALISSFSSYGNRNLNDTVLKAIPGFFKLYSPRFSPQDTIITMDYPTTVPVEGKTGIDAIEEYVDRIAEEQRFLASFPPGYVESVLRSYTPDYRDHFFNLTEIVTLLT
ncbi:MAG: DUF6179 domain-containing protein [Lachnospiraceae bacterium]|nr:DUF6179 domain-containing protein [Lachnospiraceae bacterium]